MLAPAPLRTPEEQLQLLAHYLCMQHGSLLVVVSPDGDAERALAEEVQLRIKDEVGIEQVVFAPESVERLSLSHHLSTLLPPSGKAAVFVFGLDDLPPDARATAINAMNWGRERLRWSGYTVVLWVRPGTPGELGNRAPDFFSWRSDVFEFDIPSDLAERQRLLARLRLFAPAALDELRQRYCDYVVRTYQWLDFRGLLQLRNVVRLPLDEVFVPLQATTTVEYPLASDFPPTSESTTPDDRRRYERQRIERREALNDAVRQHRHLVVLGDPGSGKSTLLRFLALTFARGRQQVQKQLGINEDRVPILVPLSAFAEARKTQSDLPLATFLPRYFLEQSLPDFSPLFDDALSSGRALVLLDGLDEMLTADDRTAVARAVVEFTTTHPTSRVVVTSRIAGYAPGMLPASFATFTVAPLDDEAIKQFAKQWSLAFEAIGLPSHTDLPPEARRRAQLRADSLTAAATGHPGVRRLATNPLLLTLLALIHYQGTRLPNRRTDLYRLCVEALAETWNLARSLSGRPIDLRLGERRLDEEFVVHILAPVAYWMHENKPTGLISREELAARVAEQFTADGSPTDAPLLARDFVNLAREQLGLLVERAPEEFSFLHLSVQEYLAARFLSERKDGFERLRPRLHHPRWREVVLLTAGCLRGDYASEFVEDILNAHSCFDNLSQRALALKQGKQKGSEIRTTLLSISDLLVAARCIGDDVSVPPSMRQRIRDALFDLWRQPPFLYLRGEITRSFAYLKGSVIGSDVLGFLLHVVQDSREDRQVRGVALETLGHVGQGEAEVARTLLSVARDNKEDKLWRIIATDALGHVGQGEVEVARTLLRILEDRSEDEEVRSIAARAIGEAAQQEEAEVVRTLLSILRDRNEDKWVRGNAATGLGQIGKEKAEVVRTMLHILKDRSENEEVRQTVAGVLGQVAQREAIETLQGIAQDKEEDEFVRGSVVWELGWTGRKEDIETLQNLVLDKSENRRIRGIAIETLGRAGRKGEEIVKTLLGVLQDSSEDGHRRGFAAYALGQVGQGEIEVVKTLLSIVQDNSEDAWVRSSAAHALGQVGQGEIEVVKTLLSIVQDNSENTRVRSSAAQALGQVEQSEVVVETLLRAADEPALRDDALSALWDALTSGA